MSEASNVIPFAQTANPAEIRALSSAIIERFQLLRQAGVSFGGLRDLYEILGYDRTLTVVDYRDRYARGGIAGRIIDAFPNATWRGELEIIQDENPKISTPFETACDELATRLNVNAVFRIADVLAQQSYFSVILIGAPGNFDEELPRGRHQDIKYLKAYLGEGGPGLTYGSTGRNVGGGATALSWAGATVLSYEDDPQNERYGQPTFYALHRLNATSADTQRKVHWSRIIHVADGCLDNDVFGTPRLERVWNYLDDLDKCIGGGSEAFWIKANAGLHANVDPTVGLPRTPTAGTGLDTDARAILEEKIQEYQHKMNRFILTRGVDIKELGGTPADFASQVDAIVTLIAGALAMPKRILTGSEMGELASSQDRDNWKDQINGRQGSFAGPYIVRRFYDRLIAYGYVPSPNIYTVRWPHIQTLTEAEKSAGAKDWASVNATQGAVVFTENQIREHWYQMEALTPAEESDGLNDIQKSELARNLAMVNKLMGVTVYTDEEIRKMSFQLDPLADDQKLPISAPISNRFSGTVPGSDDKSFPGTKSAPKLLGPATGNVVSALETAIALGRASLDVPALRAAMASGDSKTVTAMLQTSANVVVQALREPIAAAFNPDQPRDKDGKFGKGGLTNRPSSHFKPINEHGRDTHELHSNGHAYSPQRAALHAEIVNQHLKGTTPVENPTAIILGGGPASGKSSVVDSQKIGAENTVHIDADKIRAQLPEYKEGVGKNPNIAAHTHEEASHIAKLVTQAAVSGQRNLLLDGTGDSTIEKLGGKTALMRSGGHEVVGQYVSLPTDLAVQLMKERGAKTGRYVPETFLRETHASVARTFPEAVKQGLFDRAELHDTSIHNQPRLVASSKGRTLTVHDQKLYNEFLAKGH